MFELEILTNCISWFALVKKEPSPVADQQPAAPKKSFLAQKKEKAAPEPEKQEEAGDQFKLKKKSSVGPRKQLPAKEEEPAFGGFKLKKAETVKRQWDDGAGHKWFISQGSLHEALSEQTSFLNFGGWDSLAHNCSRCSFAKCSIASNRTQSFRWIQLISSHNWSNQGIWLANMFISSLYSDSSTQLTLFPSAHLPNFFSFF